MLNQGQEQLKFQNHTKSHDDFPDRITDILLVLITRILMQITFLKVQLKENTVCVKSCFTCQLLLKFRINA